MKKQIIELFSGSKSVAETFESHGWETVTVDNNAKLNPSMCCDILALSPALLPKKVDFVWASPDCSKFSRAADQSNWLKTTIKYRIYDYKPNSAAALLSLQLLAKTIEILNYYPGVLFIIENPIGRLHHMDPMKNLGHYRYAVNYADFGFGYSKETYLFSNMMLPFSTKKVHSSKPGMRTIHSSFNRAKVPRPLVEKIISYI
ncbi:MAG: DNA cytosine methyltransferase [Peptostreptococcaceae bacterium]|nr:DNA cytosine methyltransferase [Peptostreptococcaceae bacterium]